MISNYVEAYDGVRVITDHEESYSSKTIDVVATYGSPEAIVSSGRKDVIYLRIVGAEEEASARLTIDEAKEVAIALFDQIMFFGGGQENV